MAFRTNPAPYQRAKKSTLQIMLILCAALAVVWLFAIVYSFKLDGLVNKNTHYGLNSILIVLVALLTTAACDALTTIAKHKKDSKLSLGKEIIHDLIHNYSYVTAIIFALTLPVYTSYYVVIIGSIFATVVVKNFFGGFGKNIFNPAIMARIFVGLCFASQMSVPEVLKTTGAGIDGISGATLTTAFNNASSWLSTSFVGSSTLVTNSIFADYTLVDMLFGNYVGALGETFTVVIFVLGIVLSVLKVINWRTPVFYLSTVAVSAFVIALVCGFNNPFAYVLYHLSLGGLMFGAVFMLTDPVTGPTSPFGKSLVAVIAGFLTVLIRVKGGYPEGVMYSIAICNLISPAIDYLTVGKSSAHIVRKYCGIAGTFIVSVVLCSCIAFNVNGGKEVYSINGIDIAEYNYVTQTLGFNLKDKDCLSKKENGKEAYFVVDENGTKVAVVYDVKLDEKTVIVVEGYPQEFNLHAYIAISLSDDSVYEIAFVKGGSADTYKDAATSYVDENFIGLGQSAIANKEIIPNSCGATYSVTDLKKAINIAYNMFVSEYK